MARLTITNFSPSKAIATELHDTIKATYRSFPTNVGQIFQINTDKTNPDGNYDQTIQIDESMAKKIVEELSKTFPNI